jgi:RNA polymerase sigma-70 factor (ECF subfamily)
MDMPQSNNSSGEDAGRWIRSAVDQYEDPLLQYALRLVGDLDRARDVVQETFLQLCRQDPNELDGHLAQWLYTVTRNRALDVRRKEKRMQTMPPQEANGQVGREKDQSAQSEQNEEATRIEEVLQDLPDPQQEVIRLKFQSDLSYKEIGEVLDLPVSHVGYLIRTAIGQLRKELGAERI